MEWIRPQYAPNANINQLQPTNTSAIVNNIFGSIMNNRKTGLESDNLEYTNSIAPDIWATNKAFTQARTNDFINNLAMARDLHEDAKATKAKVNQYMLDTFGKDQDVFTTDMNARIQSKALENMNNTTPFDQFTRNTASNVPVSYKYTGKGNNLNWDLKGNSYEQVYNFAKQVGIDPAHLMYIMDKESGGNINAKNPYSSASGAFQFTDSTFKETYEKYGRAAGLENDKNNPYTQAFLTAKLEEENRAYLRQFGYGEDVAAGSIAHFLGAGGAKEFYDTLKSNPNMTMGELFGEKFAKSHGRLGDKKVSEYYNEEASGINDYTRKFANRQLNYANFIPNDTSWRGANTTQDLANAAKEDNANRKEPRISIPGEEASLVANNPKEDADKAAKLEQILENNKNKQQSQQVPQTQEQIDEVLNNSKKGNYVTTSGVDSIFPDVAYSPEASDKLKGLSAKLQDGKVSKEDWQLYRDEKGNVIQVRAGDIASNMYDDNKRNSLVNNLWKNYKYLARIPAGSDYNAVKESLDLPKNANYYYYDQKENSFKMMGKPNNERVSKLRAYANQIKENYNSVLPDGTPDYQSIDSTNKGISSNITNFSNSLGSDNVYKAVGESKEPLKASAALAVSAVVSSGIDFDSITVSEKTKNAWIEMIKNGKTDTFRRLVRSNELKLRDDDVTKDLMYTLVDTVEAIFSSTGISKDISLVGSKETIPLGRYEEKIKEKDGRKYKEEEWVADSNEKTIPNMSKYLPEAMNILEDKLKGRLTKETNGRVKFGSSYDGDRVSEEDILYGNVIGIGI